MGVVEPTNLQVKSLKGLHLYHSGRSNCSARVRLLFAERELDWESHHIDLLAKENISEDYFGINPKGLVPALVYDGTVVIESCDILRFVEAAFPDPQFEPASEAAREEIDQWLDMSGDMHVPTVKTFQYYKMNARLLKKSKEEEELYDRLQTDPQLKAFHGKHAGGRSFSKQDADVAIDLLNKMFAKMEVSLTDSDWIVGDTYSLADIAWAPSVTTLLSGGFDLSAFPNVERWYANICQRPQYQTAVIEWRNQQQWEKL